MYAKGCRCRPCKNAKAAYMRKYRGGDESEPPVTIRRTVLDVLELNMTSMGRHSITAWVLELHPEWLAESVRQTLLRMVSDGAIERVEFGQEVRYRLP